MRLLLIPLLSSLFLLFLSQASLAKGESYYYAKTYFSKVAVPSLSCPPGAKTLKNSGGITCQRKCENNMTQVGNFCEPNRSKRRVKKSVYACQKKKKIMGVETCTKRGYECRGGYKGPKKIGGLVPMCLSPCPENFRGTSIAGVPHCINRQGRYSVISLKATPVCNKSFDLTAAGTCLEVCKKNYSHVIGTNVCAIRRAPAGYSFCSFKGWQSPGFARGYDVSLGNKKVRISAKLNCEIMYASQIYTVQSLVSAAKEMACPPCKAQREGNKAALLAAYSDNIEDAKSVGPKLLRELDPLAKEIYTVVRKGGAALKASIW